MLEIPPHEVGPVTKAILERSSGDERASATIEDSFRQFEVCREFDRKYPDVLKYTTHLEGLSRTLGIHAAGVVTSPVPLEETIPLETRLHNGERVVVTAMDHWEIQGFGLLKFDVLGLKTMTQLRIARELVRDRHGVDHDYEQMPLDDAETLDGFTRHDYGAVFQYDTPAMDKVSGGVKFEAFEDVVALNALNRPGTSRSGLAAQYVDRKKNPEKVKETSMHPRVSEITADSLGIIVYQEHVIKIFVEVAGFHPGNADRLRKDIGKSLGDEKLGREREKFVRGAVKNTAGMDEKTAHRIMDAITFFGSYGFNKSHATEYGMIGYWCMYMKQHYPLEFFAAALRCEQDTTRIQKIVKDVKAHEIEVRPPDVNTSGAEFSIDGDTIRGSLVDIKGVGTKAAASIMEHQPYRSFTDFIARVDRRAVHKGVVQALVLAGALDSHVPNPKWFVENIEAIWKLLGRKDSTADVLRLLKLSAKVPGWSDEDRILEAAKVSPLAFGRHPIDAYSDFIEANTTVPIIEMADEEFFKRNDAAKVGGIYVVGIVTEIKLNQIGDFHTGKEPDDETKRRMGWGKRYANVNIEDATGYNVRVKFDWDIFDDYWTALESGRGNPIIVHVSVNAQYENMRAHFAVDLAKMKRKLEEGESLSYWEHVIRGDHPALLYEWESPKRAKLARKDIRLQVYDAKRASKNGARVTFRLIGVVSHVRAKPDKNGNLMGFFGLLGAEGYVDVLAFSSTWTRDVRRAVKPGHLIEIELGYNRGSAIYTGGTLRWFKDSQPTLAKASKTK
jgi:DNA polymerase III alpha subunit